MASLSNRVISIYNRKTSMRLAPAEWEAIDTICRRENIQTNADYPLLALKYQRSVCTLLLTSERLLLSSVSCYLCPNKRSRSAARHLFRL